MLAVSRAVPAGPPACRPLDCLEHRFHLSAAEISHGEKVGQGSSATVFRGTCRGMVVAVKELSAVAERCSVMRELRVLQQVRHPNLVALVGVFQNIALGKVQLITTFCEGGSLFDLLHERRIRPVLEQRQRAALDVARAMSYLHCFDPPIMHRDLKSQNLLLQSPVWQPCDNIEVKVADFGLARMQVNGSWRGLTAVTGTSLWMAPEVHKGEEYDHKADVYSYGMVFYELMCQELPFDGQEEELGPRVVKGARPDLTHLPEDCKRSLRKLMTDCWSQDPAARPEFYEVCGVLLAQEEFARQWS